MALLTLPAAAAPLVVEVEGVAPGAGRVYVAVCAGALDEGACGEGQSAPAEAGAHRFGFDMPPGTYAVLAYQDTNGNGRPDRTPLGLPTEPYGLSNGAGRRARPDFAAAAFTLGERGAGIRVRLLRALGGR
ncbi:MAG: DUF2141 domain-containing protein [Methylobacterium frigidaeris]